MSIPWALVYNFEKVTATSVYQKYCRLLIHLCNFHRTSFFPVNTNKPIGQHLSFFSFFFCKVCLPKAEHTLLIFQSNFSSGLIYAQFQPIVLRTAIDQKNWAQCLSVMENPFSNACQALVLGAYDGQTGCFLVLLK